MIEDLYSRYETTAAEEGLEKLEPVYNLCPTQMSTVLVQSYGRRRLVRMRWQLVPSTEPIFSTKLSTINARSESVFRSRLYGDLILRRRCIIPASGFFEWKRTGTKKRPFKIYVRSEPIMSLAGIWDIWKPGTPQEQQSFAIITTTANELMADIHDRMPVILGRPDEAVWLDPNMKDRERLSRLMAPCPSSWLKAVEVSPLVNSSKNNTPDVLKPVESGSSNSRGALPLFE